MSNKRLLKLIDLLFDGNQCACARALGKGERTIRRWVAGDDPVPEAVAMLLETLAALNVSPARARAYAKLEAA